MREPTCACCKEIRAAINSHGAELLKIMDKHWPDEDEFDKALPHILKYEGGYVNDPDDAGGETYRGIIKDTYDSWRESKGLPTRSVRHLEEEEDSLFGGKCHPEIKAIYRENYWVKGRAAELLWPLNLVHFDSVVNHGIGGGAEKLQAAVGVKVDGAFGPMTLGAARKLDPKQAALKVIAVREAWYKRRVVQKPSQKKFLNGWLNRMKALREVVG